MKSNLDWIASTEVVDGNVDCLGGQSVERILDRVLGFASGLLDTVFDLVSNLVQAVG